MMAERSKVQFGKTTIPIVVRRSKQRGQVSLVVQGGQKGVLVYASADTPLDRLAALVRERGAWAASKLRQVALADGPDRPRGFVSGEGFTYLGRSFRLAGHVERVQLPPRLERGWLTATVASTRREAGRRRATRKQVIAWFKDRAEARLPERLGRYTKKLGLEMPKLLMRDQSSRWGSCDEKGVVRLNWRRWP